MKITRNLAFMALAIVLAAQVTRAALGPDSSIISPHASRSAVAPRALAAPQATGHWHHYAAQPDPQPVANRAGQRDPWSGTSWQGYVSEPYHYSCGGRSVGQSHGGCDGNGCDGNGCDCSHAAIDRFLRDCPLFQCNRGNSGCDRCGEDSGCDDYAACDEPAWERVPYNILEPKMDAEFDTDADMDAGSDVDSSTDVNPDADVDADTGTDDDSQDLLEPMPLPPHNPKPVVPPTKPAVPAPKPVVPPRNLLPKQAVGRLRIEISGTPASFETKERQPAPTGTILRFKNGPTPSNAVPSTGGIEIQLLGLESE